MPGSMLFYLLTADAPVQEMEQMVQYGWEYLLADLDLPGIIR